MCVAIVARIGHRVSNLQMYAGWTRNKDGGGFAYVHDGKVVISKGFMTYSELIAAYSAAFELYGATSAFLVHMRVRSAGSVSQANTHPFPVMGGALIHNGTMFTPTGEKLGPADDRWSDTRGFAESLHDKLSYENACLAKTKLEKLIGAFNKIALLYDNGQFVILNEASGEWVDDVWFSNNYSCRVNGIALPTTETGSGTSSSPNPNAV